MLHPSYTDLMKIVNSDVEIGEEPLVNSRYSIVIATAKRARQIISGDKPRIKNTFDKKPFSIAVEELYNQDVKILRENEEYEDYIEEEDCPEEEAVTAESEEIQEQEEQEKEETEERGGEFTEEQEAEEEV